MALRNALTKAKQQSTKGPRKPILISSHPDPEPEALVPSEAAIDAPTQDDFQRGPDAERPKPIVSINGNDIEPEEPDCNAA